MKKQTLAVLITLTSVFPHFLCCHWWWLHKFVSLEDHTHFLWWCLDSCWGLATEQRWRHGHGCGPQTESHKISRKRKKASVSAIPKCLTAHTCQRMSRKETQHRRQRLNGIERSYYMSRRWPQRIKKKRKCENVAYKLQSDLKRSDPWEQLLSHKCWNSFYFLYPTPRTPEQCDVPFLYTTDSALHNRHLP
jgi:hypothetical protein